MVFTRKLQLDDGQSVRELTLTIGPIDILDNGDACCHYSLPDILERSSKSYGIDEIDAIMAALSSVSAMIKIRMQFSPECRIWFLTPDDGGCLPQGRNG